VTDRIRTLVLDANGFGWKPILADTVLQGFLGIESLRDTPGWARKISFLIHALNQHYEKLSYVMDWRDELVRSPLLQAEICNINNLVALQKARKSLEEYPLVVILHSAAGDSMKLLLRILPWFQRRRGKVVMFIGNEYDLMDEKIRFIQQAGVEYVCSQLPEQAARWLYAECRSSKILTMPHALNPGLYHPGEAGRRPVELGFRGARYPKFIGDSERNDLLDFFERNAASLGVAIDFSYQNMRRGEWADFLRGCRAVVGAEAGTYYLDQRGRAITAARRYMKENPQADIPEIKARFFDGLTDYISGKSISSRHFEPIGAKTCQVLLEGEYNGILTAGEHYIAIRKDYSNIQEVVRQLKDDAFREEMTRRAYEYVMENHTYAHRIRGLMDILQGDGL